VILSGTSASAPYVAGALAVLVSNNHNGPVDVLYETLKAAGNYNYQDIKGNKPFKAPLLDMRKLFNDNMTASCA
jgi:subtilisin family serine protease